jgi:6-phosphogluconolactonase
MEISPTKWREAQEIKILDKEDDLAEKAADCFLKVVKGSVQARGRALVALSGGSTPYPLYRQLSQPEINKQIPWHKINIFWGDERLVPADHEESNSYQAMKRLLHLVPVPPGNIYRVNGDLSPAEAVSEYKSVINRFVEPGREITQFDLILLGVGDDGHTASLFPGLHNPGEYEDIVISVISHYAKRPAARVTFTPRLINKARNVYFLVSGGSKARAVKNALSGEYHPLLNPTQRIFLDNGKAVWLIEKSAASLLGDC